MEIIHFIRITLKYFIDLAFDHFCWKYCTLKIYSISQIYFAVVYKIVSADERFYGLPHCFDI